MATFHDLTTIQLKQAVQMREQIESLQAKLNALLGGAAPSTTKKKLGQPKGKRSMSAAGRANIAAAVKARWAVKKKGAAGVKQAFAPV